MANTDTQEIPPAHPTAAQQRCEICGASLVGITSINSRCSPCFWARTQDKDPSLWKVNPEYEKCPSGPPFIATSSFKLDKAIKFDDGKLLLDLLPFEALEEITLVLQHGAKKYSAHNWRKGFIWSRPFAAILRHLFAYWKGEDLDKDSGLHHLAHAGCELLFLLSFVKTQTGVDDRYGKQSNS